MTTRPVTSSVLLYLSNQWSILNNLFPRNLKYISYKNILFTTKKLRRKINFRCCRVQRQLKYGDYLIKLITNVNNCHMTAETCFYVIKFYLRWNDRNHGEIAVLRSFVNTIPFLTFYYSKNGDIFTVKISS